MLLAALSNKKSINALPLFSRACEDINDILSVEMINFIRILFSIYHETVAVTNVALTIGLIVMEYIFCIFNLNIFSNIAYILLNISHSSKMC